MRLSALRGSTCVAVLVGAVEYALAQGAVRSSVIASRPTCPTCELVVSAPIQLDPAFAPGILYDGANAVDSRSRVVTASPERGKLVLFDSAGQFRYTIGRQGSGPGEFAASLLRVWFGARDSLHVFDPQLRRVSVFEPERGALVRTMPMPWQVRTAVPLAARGGFVVAAAVGSPERAGFPLHRISADGRLEKSFGSHTQTLIPGRDPGARVVAVSDNDGTIWTAQADSYVLEQWNTDGQLLRRLERRAEWFVNSPTDDRQQVFPSVRTQLTALHQDDRGRLWIFIRKTIRRERVPEGRLSDPAVLERIAQSMAQERFIEVIDPAREALILSRPGAAGIPLRADVLLVPGSDQEGHTFLMIKRLSLRNTAEPRPNTGDAK